MCKVLGFVNKYINISYTESSHNTTKMLPLLSRPQGLHTRSNALTIQTLNIFSVPIIFFFFLINPSTAFIVIKSFVGIYEFKVSFKKIGKVKAI